MSSPRSSRRHNARGANQCGAAALFELLVLEINQAGLSWMTILKKREAFRRGYNEFDLDAVAGYGDADRVLLLGDAGIIRNRLKVEATIENARRILALRRASGGSFAGWLDAHHPPSLEEWRRLVKRTSRFTGGEIVREFLVRNGYLPGAHQPKCPVYHDLEKLEPPWSVTPSRYAR